jgi:hypothetical protein
MADKLVSLVASSNFIRYRDIWDLRFLAADNSIAKSKAYALVPNKLKDYSVADYYERTVDFLLQLPEIVESNDFLAQMTRFLPAETLKQTLLKEQFRVHIIEEIKHLYDGVMQLSVKH